MLIITTAQLDFWGDRPRPITISDGATLDIVGTSDGPVERWHLTYQGERYRCTALAGSAWSVLTPAPVKPCQLCGEDLNHPSQHVGGRAHACNRT